MSSRPVFQVSTKETSSGDLKDSYLLGQSVSLADVNCKTCKFWERYVERYPNRKPSGEEAGGYCQSPKLGENWGKYEPDTLIYSYTEGGRFWTGPDFGCVHWQK